MDTPRRWQVASLVTAAASLGIGGLAISRPSVEPVAPIVIDLVPGGYATEEPAGTSGLPLVPAPVETAGAEPTVVEPLTPASLASVQSVASPDEPATSLGPAAPPPAPPAPASTPTGREQLADSPDDVDSPASIDS